MTETQKSWTPREEVFICRIVTVALNKSKRSPGIMKYGRIAECINEAGRRLMFVGYGSSATSLNRAEGEGDG